MITNESQQCREVFLLAQAVKNVPGFSVLVWNAACKLCETRSAIAEREDYEATHKRNGTKEHRYLARREYHLDGEFSNALDSAEIILRAIDSNAENQDSDYEPDYCYAVLDEVHALVDSLTYKEIYMHARMIA